MGIQSTAPPIFASTTPTTIPEGCIIPDGVPPSWLGKCSKICFCLINPIFSLGDNFCDALFYNAECLFDLGDCHVGVSVSPEPIGPISTTSSGIIQPSGIVVGVVD